MIVLVGEMNPYGASPEFALYPYPRLSAGGRLCTRILGMRDRDYIALKRFNLCVGAWHLDKARKRAEELRAFHAADVFVLLGRKVQSAFGFKPRDPQFSVAAQGAYILLPHPSGRCLVWNDPAMKLRAQELVRSADPSLKLGFKP